MKKIFSILLIILVLCGCQTAHSLESDNRILKLGYCPTMQGQAENFSYRNKNIELVRFGSADEVLRNMNNGLIDVALIGRKAKSYEVGDVSEKRLNPSAYTLIGSVKRMINYRELQNLKIKTCLDENIAHEHFPELNLVFEDCNFLDDGIWLVSWDDFSDEMELFIPVDENGNKIAKYRTPFLYGEMKNTFIF